MSSFIPTSSALRNSPTLRTLHRVLSPHTSPSLHVHVHAPRVLFPSRGQRQCHKPSKFLRGDRRKLSTAVIQLSSILSRLGCVANARLAGHSTPDFLSGPSPILCSHHHVNIITGYLHSVAVSPLCCRMGATHTLDSRADGFG